MDTFGAVIGPALALIFLFLHPGQYKLLFWLAFVPGLGAIALTLLLKEHPAQPRPDRRPFGLMQGFRYWGQAPQGYRKLVSALLVFALVNSSDMLLLLRIRESGQSDPAVIGVYIFYNLVFALLAYPVGKFADRSGIKKTMVWGLAAFALVYFGFAVTDSLPVYLGLLLLYGFYAAATDGISKAWISKLVPKEEAASAIGTFAGFQSIAALVASAWAGFIWQFLGPGWAFGITAAVAALVGSWIAYQGSRIPDKQPFP
jgi:MFS family permease